MDLPHAGRTRDEHESASDLRDVAEDGRQVEIGDGLDLQGDDAQDDVVEASLTRDVHTETTFARKLEGKVAFVEVEVLSDGVVLDQDLDDLFRVLGCQNLEAEFDELAVEPIQGQVSDLKVDIARTLLESESEKPIQLFPFHRRSLPAGSAGARRVGRSLGLSAIGSGP